jgi:hypothetical protein
MIARRAAILSIGGLRLQPRSASVGCPAPQKTHRPLLASRLHYRRGPVENLKGDPMVDQRELLERLIVLAEELGVQVRREPIDGESGGLCRIKGRQVLFIDTLADLDVRVDRCLEALARLPEIDEHYVLPEIREQIDRIRARGQ